MKIIHTDNYGGDYPDEQFVTEIPSMNKERMQSIADAINKAIGLNTYRYYEVVEDDYKLSPGFEP